MNSTLQQIMDMIGSPRLLVSLQNKTARIEALIPPLLMQFISTSRIDLSRIHVLDCIDEDILQQAVQYLSEVPGGLDFITRDFEMNKLPSIANDLLDAVDPSQKADLSSVLSQVQASTGLDLTTRINDPFYRNGSQWYLDVINATSGWQLLTGSSDVVVAIIDTGVDLDHPDLRSSLWINKGEIPGNGIDDDGNGYIDDVYGYDFAGQCTSVDKKGACTKCGGQPNSLPSLYHGTHAAGIVAATQNNGMGVTGVATGVKIMVLKVSDCLTGAITASAVFSAFDYAAKMGAHVASCSFGSSYAYGFTPTAAAPSYQSQYTQAYKTAMQPLADKGVLVVAAAGNEAIDLDLMSKFGYSYSPCLVPLPNVLCVGASDYTNSRAYFSNYGAASVHVGSPGEEIYSTYYRNSSLGVEHTYAPLNGSSMSTPMVSGSAAMALSLLGAADGNYFKASIVKSLIMNASTKIPAQNIPSTLPWQSRGLLNIGSMMTSALQLKSLSITRGSAPQFLVWPSSSFVYSGFQEVYYNLSSSQTIDTCVKTLPVGLSQPVSFTSFKYTGSLIRVSYRALVEISSVGLWAFQAKTSGCGSALTSLAILINGMQLSISNQTGLFLASSVGWFSFEFRLDRPTGGVQALLLARPPSSSIFKSYSRFLTAAPEETAAAAGSGAKAPAAVTDLYSSWDIFYRLVNVTSSPVKLSSIFNASSSSQSTIPGISDPFSSSLGSRLLTQNSNLIAIGWMSSIFQPSVANSTASFAVTCGGCQVLLDDIVILDSYLALITSSPPTAINSPCIGMTTGQHQLSIRFAAAYNSSISLNIIPCIRA